MPVFSRRELGTECVLILKMWETTEKHSSQPVNKKKQNNIQNQTFLEPITDRGHKTTNELNSKKGKTSSKGDESHKSCLTEHERKRWPPSI